MSLVPSNKEKIRDELEKLKSLKGIKLWEYIWEYYKIIIIPIAVLFVIVGASVYSAIVNPTPTTILTVAWTYESQLSEFFVDLASSLEDNLAEEYANEKVHVFTSFYVGDVQLYIAMQMRLAAMIASREVDVLIATGQQLEGHAAEGMLKDISSWLPRDTEGLLRVAGENGIVSVYGVSIVNSRILEEISFFMSDECPPPYIGVVINTNREEKTRQAVDLFLE